MRNWHIRIRLDLLLSPIQFTRPDPYLHKIWPDLSPSVGYKINWTWTYFTDSLRVHIAFGTYWTDLHHFRADILLVIASPISIPTSPSDFWIRTDIWLRPTLIQSNFDLTISRSNFRRTNRFRSTISVVVDRSATNLLDLLSIIPKCLWHFDNRIVCFVMAADSCINFWFACFMMLTTQI